MLSQADVHNSYVIKIQQKRDITETKNLLDILTLIIKITIEMYLNHKELKQGLTCYLKSFNFNMLKNKTLIIIKMLFKIK